VPQLWLPDGGPARPSIRHARAPRRLPARGIPASRHPLFPLPKLPPFPNIPTGNAKPQLGEKADRAKPGVPSAPSGFENLVTNITALAESLRGIQELGVARYTPVVETILRTRSRDVRHIEHSLRVSAPTVRPNPAQGNALGPRAKWFRALKGRSKNGFRAIAPTQRHAALDRLIAKKRDLKQAAMQQLLTGQTRLPGFKGGWVDTTLGEIGECIIGLTFQPENVVEHGLLVLRSSNVQNGHLRGSGLPAGKA
jgi:hypothetical protein